MKQNTASQRIATTLRARIRSGALAPGQRVPSAREIVREWGVALATATKVLAMLRREGLVRVEPGVGTIVKAAGRGPDLSLPIVVRHAIAIADEEGTGALTMRSLARELGVSTMALYRYVASRDHLMLLMIDAVFAEDALPRKGPGSWRTKLDALARLQWGGYRRHPWLASLVSIARPQVVKHGMLHTEWVLAALDGLGLDDATVMRTGIAFIAHVRGMAVNLEAEQHAEQDTGMSSAAWMDQHEEQFAPLLRAVPTLARMSRLHDVDMSLDALFDAGLACFLDGVGALVARAGAGRARSGSA